MKSLKIVVNENITENVSNINTAIQQLETDINTNVIKKISNVESEIEELKSGAAFSDCAEASSPTV